MEGLGVWSLVPPLFVILFALKTRKTFEALLLGAVLAYIMVYGAGFFGPFMDAIYDVMMDGDTVWVLLTCGLFGSLIALLEKSKSVFSFSRLMLKYGDTPKKSLMATWILGIIIFVDDYLNVLTIGAAMKRVTDKHKIPREMLAYIIDSTGAPVCVLIPLSTWVVFFAAVFGNQPELAFLGSGMQIYYRALPFIFYAWAALIVVPLVIMGIIPMMGPMKKAYERVESSGNVFSERSSQYNRNSEATEEDMLHKGKLIHFLIPIVVLIAVTFYTEDLLVGVILSVVSGAVIYLPFKVMNLDDYSNAVLNGFANMVPMLAIIVAAFTIQRAVAETGLTEFVVTTVQPFMSPSLFPAITFIVVAGLSFITGSNWGVPAVTVPVIAPLALAVGANPYLALAAIVSGGTFGSHACFYSDCTVLTSSATGIDNMEHALSQYPFALISAGMAIAAYLVVGFIM